MGQMNIGARSRSRLTGAHHPRGSGRSRRRDHVWLVSPPAPQFAEVAAHHITGALALDQQSHRASRQVKLAQRCTLIVERDPALARRLRHALSARYEPRYSVGLVNSSASFARLMLTAAPDVLIFDANTPQGWREAGYVFDEAQSDRDVAKIIYISRDTSFGLSQRGVTRGALVRAPASLNEMLDLVAALID